MRNSRYYICAVLLALLLPGNTYGKDAETRVVADTLEVHFRVGQSNIDMGFAGNEKRIADFTRKVELRYAGAKKESMQLNVYAGASPEGPTELNRRLGEQRGIALKELLLNRLSGIVEHVTVINQGARWGALSQMIEKSDEPWKYEVLKILGEIPEGDEWRVDPRETKLRQLRRGQVWQVLNEKYLPELRSSGSAVLMELDQRQIDTLVIRDTVIYLPEPCVYVEEPADTRRVWAVKTNLLLWGVIAPNIQVERALGRTNHWSLEAEFFWPWYIWNKNTHAEQFMNLGFELRYWMGNREKHHCLDGWHIGPAIAAGYYDFEWKKSEGWQGEYLNIYCNVGYQKRWGSRKQWCFDGGLGVGYIPTKFRHYLGSTKFPVGYEECHDHHLMWQNSGWNHIFGLTHANFSLGYIFGAKGAKPALEKVIEPDAVVDERARIKAENDAEAERQYQARYAIMNAKERKIADRDRERAAEKAAKEQARAEKEQLKAEQYAAKQRIKAEEKAAKEEAKAAEKAAKAEAKEKGEKVEKVAKSLKNDTDKAAAKAAAAEAKAAEKAAKEQAKVEAAAAKEAAKAEAEAAKAAEKAAKEAAKEAEKAAKETTDKAAEKAAAAEAKAKAKAEAEAAKVAAAEAKAKEKAEAEAAKAAEKANAEKAKADAAAAKAAEKANAEAAKIAAAEAKAKEKAEAEAAKAAEKANAEAAKIAAAEEKAKAKAEAEAAKLKAKADAAEAKAAEKAAKEAAKAAAKAEKEMNK